ncbi:MAG: septum site-determining protein MinD [Candidatus Nanohaloarchaea archaeon]|jgi:septum site-determining protein MinD
MTRVISVVSGKGGVGKTTVTCNLGVKLSQMGHEVLIIDGNFSGANVSQHFGIGFQDVSLNQVLDGDAYITQAVAKHPAGVSVLPASILEFDASAENLKHSLVEFLGDKDFVFIDAAAGIGDEVESAIEASDEVLLVSEPELPSLTNCIGARKLAEQFDREILGLVLNGVRGEPSQVGITEAEQLVEVPVIGQIDDHEHVRESIALREPVTSVRPEAKVSRQIEDLAHRMQGREPPEKGLSEKVRLKLKDMVQ